MGTDTYTYVVNDTCIMGKGCDACIEACPVECIDKGDKKVEVDHGKCVSCDVCMNACPVHAISHSNAA